MNQNRFIIRVDERYSAASDYRYARKCGVSRMEAFNVACVKHAWNTRIADSIFSQLSPIGKRLCAI